MDSKEEKKKAEKTIEVKKNKKIVASVWELLMHSKAHQEALVMALDNKKIPTSYTPKQMVGLLMESP